MIDRDDLIKQILESKLFALKKMEKLILDGCNGEEISWELRSGFVWGGTKEGFVFWKNMNEVLSRKLADKTLYSS